MKVYIQNDEPVWARYSLSVEVDDSLDDEAAKEAALEKVYAGEYQVESGPDVRSEVAGMDQEFEVTEIERPSP